MNREASQTQTVKYVLVFKLTPLTGNLDRLGAGSASQKFRCQSHRFRLNLFVIIEPEEILFKGL